MQKIIDYKKGLTNKQVKELQNKFGKNTLLKNKKVNCFVAYFKQFLDPMVILLLIAALISLALAIYGHLSNVNHGTELIVSYVEPGIIFLVVCLNSMLGAYQEVKSDQAVRALSKLNQANATVIREGKTVIVPAEDLVVGDLIVLNAGDVISADARIIEAFNLKVIESSLTGESLPVDKWADFEKSKSTILAENNHLVFSSTYVANGKAIAIVEAIAKDTEIGKINDLIQTQEKVLSPLQIKLNKLSKIFGISGIVLLLVSFILQVILIGTIKNQAFRELKTYTDSLVIGISLAVAAIPEGLITFTTVLLSIGVAQMSKQKALAKNLLAVETLGSVSIICSDKTGTLTENKMTLVDVLINNNKMELATKDEQILLAKYLTLCNDASLEWEEKNSSWIETGDPTEIALLKFAYNLNINKKNLKNEYQILDSLPFDSDRKLMSTLVKYKNKNYLITKGAPDILFNLIKEQNIDKYIETNENFAQKAYRVLAVAIKEINKEKINFADEKDLKLFALVALIDPPRNNVKETIALAKKAGIKTVMITGDHLTTAKAIAKDLGIYDTNDLAITGEELAKWDDEKLLAKVKEISVYARVNPNDKLRIVQAWQKNNQVVAMTGDGVNDAPALKSSDIGCAMGITGTDVAKQAADIVLVDDNFNTIVNSVKNGRLIFDKIKVVIMNLLISSVTEVLVMLIGMIVFYLSFRNTIGTQTEFFIFGASQLLWINLLTHGFPAIALGLVDSGKNVMNRKPYSKKENIFARGMGTNLIIQSLILSLLTLISYAFGALVAIKQNLTGAEFLQTTSTCAFITLGVAASLNSINLMSDKSIFRASLRKYWIVWIAALFSATCTIIVVIIPGLSEVFRMVDNIWNNLLILFIGLPLAFGLIIYNEIVKLFKIINSRKKDK
ncbi:cation-transporting P-type ATPase [Mycoplasma sp. 744]|uniref:cation-translocating P-type ATPase n=1 Tax=Mycoplasma sp. 744 TaxID=3108531 RepID=UPI002B1D5FFF|nr:cation-transporting P-type ATPase [Mycoplasma sp. 744]MEA4115584.1 cation-transporting P-type ATPase [Mycoplasma sp. 744]